MFFHSSSQLYFFCRDGGINEWFSRKAKQVWSQEKVSKAEPSIIIQTTWFQKTHINQLSGKEKSSNCFSSSRPKAILVQIPGKTSTNHKFLNVSRNSLCIPQHDARGNTPPSLSYPAIQSNLKNTIITDMFHQTPKEKKKKLPGVLFKDNQPTNCKDAKASWTNWFGNNLQVLNEQTRSDARG